MLGLLARIRDYDVFAGNRFGGALIPPVIPFHCLLP
jgi:hypothetical protein